MKYILLIITSILLVNCNGKKSNDTPVNENMDPFIIEDPTYEDLQEEYTKRYDSTVLIDTVLKVEGDSMVRLGFKYFCNNDTLVIPSKYSWSTNEKKDFTTYNFSSEISLYSKNDRINRVYISKNDFNRLLDETLKSYGVLLYPNFRGYDEEKNVIRFQFSISIPLTDIGKSVTLEMGLDGNFSVH